MKNSFWTLLLTGLMLLTGAGCGRETDDGRAQSRTAAPAVAATPAGAVRLRLVAGSENRELEPLIQEFARRQGMAIEVVYMGSIEIGRELAKGKDCPFDAVWPAASLWIDMFDEAKVTRNAESIMRTPVVFGVRKSVARSLGWVGADVRVMDILQAAEARKLRFAMTSASQSNSGASAYLGFLSAFAGSPEVLRPEDLAREEVRTRTQRFLGQVDRSVGSSGFLKDLLLEKYDWLDAMVNYESMVIAANQTLVARGREPLYVVYPVDGLTIADSPLAVVAKGDVQKEAGVQQLQRFLLSPESQRRIQALGWRTGLVGPGAEAADIRVFNPDWGITPDKILAPIRLPAGPVIRAALDLYQGVFRKPCCTLFVLDFSGSMRGTGERQLKEAMRILLTPALAQRYLLQPAPKDVTIVMPYSDDVVAEWKAEGNDPQVLDGLLAQIEAQNALAGTYTHKALLRALRTAKTYAATGKYHTSIVLMSDGAATDSLADFFRTVDDRGIGRDIPIYTILFAEAKERDMKALAEGMGGKMFDGRKDVAKAFREARGYN